MRYCLVSRFGLVAAFTIRSLYNSDNNLASIELEISGAFIPPVRTTGLMILLLSLLLVSKS